MVISVKVAKRKKSRAQLGSSSEYTGSMSPTENGSATLLKTEMVADVIADANPDEVFNNLNKALGVEGYGSCKTAEQLRIFKKYVPKLMKLQEATHEALCASAKNQERMYDATAERSNKRWEKDEDETIVEVASRGEMSITELAVTMGRSPAAIQTRLSQLVGIGRVSQEVAGRFIGTLDGEHVQGFIDGSLQKE